MAKGVTLQFAAIGTFTTNQPRISTCQSPAGAAQSRVATVSDVFLARGLATSLRGDHHHLGLQSPAGGSTSSP